MSNPVVRFQILSPETEKLSSFYCGLFGWEASRDNLLRYQTLDTGSERGIHGGLWPCPPGAPGFVQLFIEVEDCAAHVERAQQLGATVLIPPQALPDGDVMAVLKDPSGISFGIVKPGDK